MNKLYCLAIIFLFAFAVSIAGSKGDKAAKSSGESTEAIDSTQVTWHRYDTGMELSKANDKHIFVFFTTDHCRYCAKMMKETFTAPEVIRILNEDFIPIMVDGNSRAELDIDGYKITERNLTIAEYAVRGFPSSWFLKPDGERMGMLPGYKDANTLLDVLYFLKERVYKEMEFEEYMKNGGRKGLDKG